MGARSVTVVLCAAALVGCGRTGPRADMPEKPEAATDDEPSDGAAPVRSADASLSGQQDEGPGDVRASSSDARDDAPADATTETVVDATTDTAGEAAAEATAPDAAAESAAEDATAEAASGEASPDAVAEDAFADAGVPADAASETASQDAIADAASADAPADAATEDRPAMPPRAIAVAVAYDDVCVLLDDGGVACWGSGWDGELGNGSFADSTIPVRVSGIDDAVAISAGGYVRCALLRGGDVKCWGNNASNEIGAGAGVHVATPAVATWMTGAKMVQSTFQGTCVLLADSSVKCVGSAFTYFTGVTGPLAISTSQLGDCGLYSGGLVSCWGWDDVGELGNGSVDFAYHGTPSPVSGLGTATAIVSGNGGANCALLSDGTVWCWGQNLTGQTANRCDGGNSGCTLLPAQVSGLSGVTALSAGDSFVCALLSDGTVECWGGDVNGDLGNPSLGTGVTTSSSTPVPVTGLTGVTGISAFGYHVCAVLNDGTVECWGGDSYGETGAANADASCSGPCALAPQRIPLPVGL